MYVYFLVIFIIFIILAVLLFFFFSITFERWGTLKAMGGRNGDFTQGQKKNHGSEVQQ